MRASPKKEVAAKHLSEFSPLKSIPARKQAAQEHQELVQKVRHHQRQLKYSKFVNEIVARKHALRGSANSDYADEFT